MALANISLTNTFDEWRTRTNQLIVQGDQILYFANSAYVQANVVNAYAISAVAAGNNYTNAVGAAGNAVSVLIGSSANSRANAVGLAGNARAAVIASDVGAASNAYAVSIGLAGNAYAASLSASGAAIGAGANAYALSTATSIGTAGNNRAAAIGTSGNSYALATATLVGTAGNNYTNAVGAAGNNYTNAVGTAGNNRTTAVGAASNAYAALAFAKANASIIMMDDAENAARYVTFTPTSTGSIGSLNVATGGLTFNPSTGTLTATNFDSSSDLNKKENIVPITNAMEKVEQLNGVHFTWKQSGLPSAGIIAQDLQKVMPELVSKDMSVSYNGIIGVLVEAIKELNRRIEVLENK